MKTWVIASSFIGLGAFGFNTAPIKPIVNPPIKPVGLQAHDSHASASLLGQFRTNVSAWLYLRTDLYLHNGVEMRPLSEQELKAGKKGVGSSGNEKERLHDDSKIVTIIPPQKYDFRGILGDVERTVGSYKDMTGHSHNNPTSSLPLFRLMTALDPQFVQGWTTGGFIVLWDRKKGCVEKSLAFLQEGLQHNPQSIDILTQIAYCHLRDMSDIGYGGRHFDRALPYMLQARDAGVENFKVLTEREQEALLENYRRLSVSFRELGKYPEMESASREGLQFFPEDGPLTMRLQEALQLKKGQKLKLGLAEIADPEESH
jgi:hypothetical protein